MVEENEELHLSLVLSLVDPSQPHERWRNGY